MTAGVHVETILNPVRYTPAQIDRAVMVAYLLNRGLFILTEAPRR